MGFSVALLGGLPKPRHRLGVPTMASGVRLKPWKILLHAPALAVHEPEIEVGFSNSLLGGLPKPRHRLAIILPHAQALGVPKAEEVLGHGVALLGGLAVPRRVRKVFSVVRGLATSKPQQHDGDKN